MAIGMDMAGLSIICKLFTGYKLLHILIFVFNIVLLTYFLYIYITICYIVLSDLFIKVICEDILCIWDVIA